MSPRHPARSERVCLRVSPKTKRTLQSAAAASNKTVSEFVLHSSLTAAFETLTERRVFQLDETRWKAFTAALAHPPKDNPGLRRLLARKPAWQR